MAIEDNPGAREEFERHFHPNTGLGTDKEAAERMLGVEDEGASQSNSSEVNPEEK